MLMCGVASAVDVTVDGIIYDVITKAKQATLINGKSCSGKVVIPETINYNGVEYSMTSIGGGAFNGCTGLTSVTIPNSVTSIGKSAFGFCSGLTSVTIPNSVTSIGDQAFWYCSGLTSVTIPNSVTSIGSDAFRGCSGLTSVTIPNSVTSIGSYAFSGCSGLTSVTIPNSVTSIGDFAFYGCSGLTSVTIPNSVTSIGQSAFYGCSGLTSVTIPNSVTSIGSDAFRGCSGLTSVTIPNSVTSIGSYAFYYCPGLTSVTIGNSVTSIGSSVFSGCSGLTSVVIGNSVTSIGSSVFSGCSGLTKAEFASVEALCKINFSDNFANPLYYAHNLYIDGKEVKDLEIPNSVTSIGNYAFRGCSGLTSVTIPNSVTSIGNYAFYGCSGLTSVTIPNSVTSIGSYAFSGCSDITDVYCTAEKVPSMGSNVFKNSYVEYCTLHVPSASVDSYKSAEQWKNFGKIVTIEGGTPTYEMCIKPTITYTNGMISCTSETVGAVCHYTYTITPTVVSGEGTDSGSPKSVGGKIEVTAYATAEGYEASEAVTETFDYVAPSAGLKGDVNGDGKVTMSDANEVMNIYLDN